jgi:hypothetical protein
MKISPSQIRVPVIPDLSPPKSQLNPASWTYERLVKQIQDFESGLSSDEEIGARLVGTPGAGVLHVEDAGYWGPDLLFFYGTNEHGKAVQLIQHYTQVNLLLTALPKEGPEPRRIGFHLAKKLELDES